MRLELAFSYPERQASLHILLSWLKVYSLPLVFPVSPEPDPSNVPIKSEVCSLMDASSRPSEPLPEDASPHLAVAANSSGAPPQRGECCDLVNLRSLPSKCALIAYRLTAHENFRAWSLRHSLSKVVKLYSTSSSIASSLTLP